MRVLLLLAVVAAVLLAVCEAAPYSKSSYSRSRYPSSRYGPSYGSGWGRNTYSNSLNDHHKGGYYFADDDHYDDDYYHLYPSMGGSGSLAGGRYGGWGMGGSRYGGYGNKWWDHDD